MIGAHRGCAAPGITHLATAALLRSWAAAADGAWLTRSPADLCCSMVPGSDLECHWSAGILKERECGCYMHRCQTLLRLVAEGDKLVCYLDQRPGPNAEIG